MRKPSRNRMMTSSAAAAMATYTILTSPSRGSSSTPGISSGGTEGMVAGSMTSTVGTMPV